MSIVTWPAPLMIMAVDYGIQYDVQSYPLRSGNVDTFGLPGGRFTATVTFAPDYDADRASVEAMIAALRGGARRLRMPHFGRPIPRGTMRGSPTIAQVPQRGANEIKLNGSGTLEVGDIIGCMDHWHMVETLTTAVGGVLTVPVSPSVRFSFPLGAAVVWDRPTALWIPTESVAGPFPYLSSHRPAFSVPLLQVFG